MCDETGALGGTWTWDLRTQEVEWDAGCRALFGVPPEMTASYGLFMALMDPLDRDRVDAAVRAALSSKNEGAYEVQYGIVTPGGVERRVAASGHVVFDGGRAVRFVGFAFQILP